MSEISKTQIFPYGFYLKLKNSSGASVNLFKPKSIIPNSFPLVRNSPEEDTSQKLLIDLRGLSEISKPLLKFRISKKQDDQKEKFLKIAELKRSSQNLESLNNFFSKLKEDIFQKADKSSAKFLKFLKSSQGEYLTNHFINKALFNEVHQIPKDIKAFDEDNQSKSAEQQGLLARSGFIATQDDSSFEVEKPAKEKTSGDKAENIILRGVNLANYLGELGLENTVHKLIDKLDIYTDKLNKRYPWINPQRLDLATVALRNTNHDQALGLGINEYSHLGIKELLEIFKDDLDDMQDESKISNPKLTKLLNKLIDKTQFEHADATSIRDFYMHASLKGYQEKANQVLMTAFSLLDSDTAKTKTEDAYILNHLVNFAMKENLITNLEEIKKLTQNQQYLDINNELEFIDDDFKDDSESIEDYQPETNLVSALIQIQEKLGMEYFEQDDLAKINQGLVEHLKILQEKDFSGFTELFDQIINLDDKKKYPTLGDEIFNDGIFFYDKPFPLIDLSYLLGCFTDKSSNFKQNLFRDYYEENKGQDLIPGDLPSVYLNIKNFDRYNQISKKNNSDSLSEEDFRGKLETNQIKNELLNKLIDKLPIEVCDSREITMHYFALCDKGQIDSANHLLNRKIEQLNGLEENQEKYHEFADIVELFGYVKQKGLINENSLALNNKVLKTYSDILDNQVTHLEKGFQSLLEIIKDEKINPQYTVILLNQLTPNIVTDDNEAASTTKEKAKQTLLSSEQQDLLAEALRQRVLLNPTNAMLSETQLKKLKTKRVNELADLLQLSSQLLDLKIFKTGDIENLRKDYGDWNIIKSIDQENISSIFNNAMQQSLFSKIPEYKLDNDSSQGRDSPLYTLVNKAFETTLSLGNLDKLEQILNQALKETPIFPGNVKNDLKLSLMITDYLLSANLFESASEKNSKLSEEDKSPVKQLSGSKAETKFSADELKINRLRRKMRLHLEKLNIEQKKARQEEREIAKIRDRDFKDKPYTKYSRLVSEISKPFINQALALDANADLITTAFCRILDDYTILKRRYQDFPLNEIDKETLHLILSAEERLERLGAIDRAVFRDK